MAYPVAATAPHLRCYLLGHFRIEGAAGPIRLSRRKVEPLLAYLLLHPEKHSRERLAALFWGDFPDAEAATRSVPPSPHSAPPLLPACCSPTAKPSNSIPPILCG